jgi:glutamine amidotransferase
MRVALFDYGVGNLHSLGKALEGAGAQVVVTRDWDEALALDGLVLPGVGAFSAAVRALPDDRNRVREVLEAGLPCLGICLGMQLLFPTSEEGPGEGIGILPGRVRSLSARVVPQMGWNRVDTTDDPLFHGVRTPDEPELTVYFANSFVCEADDPTHVVGWASHDGDRFAAAVRRGNTWGTQFHPEKSSRQGRRIIKNFINQVAASLSGRQTAPPEGRP